MKMLHVTVQTVAFEEEIKFYEEQVGLVMQRDARPMKDMVFLANAAGETCVEIIRTPEAVNTGNQYLSIGFKCEDVDAKREAMIAEGFEATPMITPMPGVKFFFVKDPAGINVQFM